jgi:hypothetical protein
VREVTEVALYERDNKMEKILVGTCISVRRGHVKVGSSRGHASRTFRMKSMETLKSA